MTDRIPTSPARLEDGGVRPEGLDVFGSRIRRVARALLDASWAQIVPPDDCGTWIETISEEGKIQAPFPGDGEEMIWVADARQDSLWRDHPLFDGAEGWCFYASVPIRLANEPNCGALQVFDVRPHPYDPRLSEGLADLAALVADEHDRLISLASDLSERSARAIRDKTQAILDYSLDVICTIDAEGRFTQVSKHAVNVWGYTADELIGKSHMDMVHPEDRVATQEATSGVVQGRPLFAFVNRCIRKDGSGVPISWSANWSPAHDCMVCVARDITDRLALRQAEKLQAVGRLAGGVAHDFNNLLTIVIGASEALAPELEARPESLALAQLTLEAGKRGAELVKQLLTFSRDEPSEPCSLDTGSLLRSLKPLLQRAIGDQLTLRIEPHTEPLYCYADPVQLESAILNLCINARDASSPGGDLLVSASPVDVEEASGGLEAGPYVSISVADKGQGMPPEILERALEPFFTTKEVGKGTGLGLSTVYGFAQQSGGSLNIRSQPGQGTTVDIVLPRSFAPNAAAAAAEDKGAGSDHILVVDNDPLIRQYAARQLVGLGYRVTAVADGREALECLLSHADVDLLFTDIVMPDGMDGRELALRAGRIAPQVPVLFTSGSPEVLAANPESPHRLDILQKPYSRSDLVRSVEKALLARSIPKR